MYCFRNIVAARETCVAETKFSARKQFFFCLRNMFPSFHLKTMLTRFQCYSLKMFPSNEESTTMADQEVEEEESQAGHRKGLKQKSLKTSSKVSLLY